jgi:hypothetical protein
LSRIPPLESTIRENGLYRRNDGVGRSNGDDMTPLILDPPRRARSGDVTASADLPQYERPDEREYPVATRKRSGAGERGDAGYYVGRSPEHEQALPYVEYFTGLSHSNRWLLYSHAYSLMLHTIHFCVFVHFEVIALHLRFAYPMLDQYLIVLRII